MIANCRLCKAPVLQTEGIGCVRICARCQPMWEQRIKNLAATIAHNPEELKTAIMEFANKMETYPEYEVDPVLHERNEKDKTATGIHVRATLHGEWGSHDIATLRRESLLAWLQSRGGDNQMAEDTVGILLGHGRLREDAKP